ncbi:hypothetical protein BY996DRAFT_6585287 [Phakopsora pachyrhizi]|nr:hypothetical protein BY996DRAFT_6585287 [Phakopsora pachyrhizi]
MFDNIDVRAKFHKRNLSFSKEWAWCHDQRSEPTVGKIRQMVNKNNYVTKLKCRKKGYEKRAKKKVMRVEHGKEVIRL